LPLFTAADSDAVRSLSVRIASTTPGDTSRHSAGSTDVDADGDWLALAAAAADAQTVDPAFAHVPITPDSEVRNANPVAVSPDEAFCTASSTGAIAPLVSPSPASTIA
jgi:hypothetical protein